MSENWNSEKKEGSPPCGLYLKIKSSDFGLGDKKIAQDKIRDLRLAIQAINTAPYEKNSHIIEFSIDGAKSDGKEIADGLRDITAHSGVVLLIKDNLTIAKEINADGVFLSDISKCEETRKIIGDDPIIATISEDFKVKNIGADLIVLKNGFNINELIKFKIKNNDLAIMPDVKGLTNDNCADFVKAGCDFLDVTEYVWNHEESPAKAIVNMLYAIEITLDNVKLS